MNQRERFRAIMEYKKPDRLPVYYFGAWEETFQNWAINDNLPAREAVPQLTGMDPDWEVGMWEAQGLVRLGPWPEHAHDKVVEEDAGTRVIRTALGALVRESKQGSSIPQHIEEALLPTRASWQRFKQYLDPGDPRRQVDGWQNLAREFNKRDRVATFMAGSLFGWPRDWMGLEAISYLSYDDPILYEEIIDHLTNYFIELYRPILQIAEFDFAYIFEDCCGSAGSLLSPATYSRYYHRYYVRLIDFYHSAGIRYVLIDSDGKTDALLPLWLDSGFDIVFPIEVGTWQANPVELRKRYGKRLRMFGGVDKHIIPQGRTAIRRHLENLLPVVSEGGYIPIPDHRIPPNCSLAQLREYVDVFRQVFG